MTSSATSVVQATNRRRRLALLLPGHNEELIIAATIRSAVVAGLDIQDIYVVDDCSSDNTAVEAHRLLPSTNVLSVGRSGKALAVQKAIKHFDIENRYVWVHIADADSVFGANYFRIFKQKLQAKKYALAIGFVQSQRGNWISKYRTFSYTYGQQVHRRIQAKIGAISVFPGPVTCFRTDIIKELDFTVDSLTEDFDLTLQFHRKKLGKIRYIPKAVNFTQDPQTYRDFSKQTLRWQRGFFQGMLRHRIGTKAHILDAYVGYQILQTFLYLMQLLVAIPYLSFTTHNPWLLPTALALNFAVMSLIAVGTAAVVKRPSILLGLPGFYLLSMTELALYFWAYLEVVAFRRFRKKVVGWDTEGRRYALNAQALQDTAA